MVRHEAAEALGAIATEDTTPTLKKFATDKEDVVRESCYVGALKQNKTNEKKLTKTTYLCLFLLLQHWM